MAVRVVVKDKDLGLKRILLDIEAIKRTEILIGIQEGTLTKAQTKGNRMQVAGDSVAEYGAKNEFGTAIIKPRSFMRTSFDENLIKVEEFIGRQYRQIIDGKKTVRQGMGSVGQKIQDNVKKKIRQITTPVNSPRTIAIKKSSKPLIDFGQLFASIRWVLRSRKP